MHDDTRAGLERLARFQPPVRPQYTFDTFVSGAATEFAFAVARRVACGEGLPSSLVSLHGPYGCGKTHLLLALAHEVQKIGRERVLYLTGEQLHQLYVRVYADQCFAELNRVIDEATLILLDDLHFVAAKAREGDELWLALRRLIVDRRTVVALDRGPSELAEVDPNLRSYLQVGLVCGIEQPDRTHRIAILERKLQALAEAGGFRATARSGTLEYIADRFNDSVRELEGALNTLVARVGSNIATLSVDDVQQILRPHLSVHERRVTVDMIQKAVAEHYALRQADLLSERRARSVARPRQVAMWIAKQITTRSLPDIGRRFGGRDHTTVLHAVRRIEELKKEDPVIARDTEVLLRKLRG